MFPAHVFLCRGLIFFLSAPYPKTPFSFIIEHNMFDSPHILPASSVISNRKGGRAVPMDLEELYDKLYRYS